MASTPPAPESIDEENDKSAIEYELIHTKTPVKEEEEEEEDEEGEEEEGKGWERRKQQTQKEDKYV